MRKEHNTDPSVNVYFTVATCVVKIAVSSDRQALCLEHLTVCQAASHECLAETPRLVSRATGSQILDLFAGQTFFAPGKDVKCAASISMAAKDSQKSRKARQDGSVMATNNSSIVSKRSVERLYYPEPHFYRYFVKKPLRRAPLINRK